MTEKNCKSGIKVLGIDDGPNDKSGEVIIAGVILRGRDYLEGVLSSRIMYDGMDSTDKISYMVNNTRHKKQLKVIMTDGVTMGGFNPIDINQIFQETGVPVISITRKSPDMLSIYNALKNNFSDWEKRWNIISSGATEKVLNNGHSIYIKRAGISFEETLEIISSATVRGAVPEPVRMAHLITSGMVIGHSGGKV